ncbi:ABC transporter ATP-binding protein [Nocardia jinanensis]|uniref:ABC transporter ATP-binding protein n=1 Tax=Nocardia jinanensis TaxID=382504 RepID=A0A917RK39_9NOCA|nr:ATP-binding cassette domain-containing protein [Nocardia jinanensis]GGL12110.1 ABC transporter ATP-binding protein [Nocardia jinanensis]
MTDEMTVETEGVVVDELSVRSLSGAELLEPTSLRVAQGTITAITGPSGAGKTTLMRAVLGHLAGGTTRSSGSVRVCGQDVFALEPAALQSFRRSRMAFVSQDPGAALNPTMRVRSLLTEAVGKRAGADLVATLERVGLPGHYLRRRPGELSGGEQRRVALALGLVRKVGVLVVDEPIAGLHGQLRNEIGDLLRSLATDEGVAVVVSGHDTTALHRVADHVVNLGEPPKTPQRPTGLLPTPAPADSPALQGRAISARAGGRALLESVDLAVSSGEAVAVVGPSGAGKTTLARVLAGLHTNASGTLEVGGRRLAVGRSRRSRRDRRRIQLIPQNPLSTLNPKHTVLRTLSRPLRLAGVSTPQEVAERAEALMRSVELDSELLRRYPDELSGGQRQRVAIARALAAEPDVLLCDEITSALDAGTATAIMEMVERTRVERGIGVLVISHDMTLIAEHCRQIVVIADGKVVETGNTAEVLAEPSSPHTRALLT